MSYDILYKKKFIKVDDNHVIPFMLMGSNNVFETDKKRARDWGNTYAHSEGRAMIVNNDALLCSIDTYRETTMKRCEQQVKEYNDDNWAYNDKHWGYHTSLAIYPKSTRGTSFSAYKSFFKNGIKEAMTIEELRSVGVSIYLKVTPFIDKEELKEKNLEVLPNIFITSTKHLIDSVTEYEAYYSGLKSASFWLDESGMDLYFDRQVRVDRIARLNKRGEKKSVTVNEYYVLKRIDEDKYFIKNLKYGYKYCFNPFLCKAFISEKSAKAFHNRMRNKENFSIRKVDSERSFSI